MELPQEDFGYVDQMLNKRKETHALGRIRPEGLAEAYSYLKMYWMTYWQSDEERSKSLLHLIAEIKYMYNRLYPNEVRIEDNRNTRFAGRPRKYDEAFDDKVMKLLQEGYGPTEIASKLGCSKSFVSKIKRKRRFR